MKRPALILFLSFIFFQNLHAETQNSEKNPTEQPAKILARKKIKDVGTLEIICTQQPIEAEKEMTLIYRLRGPKKINSSGYLLQTKTYNACESYRFRINFKSTADLKLIMTAGPGAALNEAGATVTTIFQWKKSTQKFNQISQIFFSPYKAVKIDYLRALQKLSFAEAEKIIIVQRKKVESAITAEIEQAAKICEDFNSAYQKEALRLYRQKKFKESFDLYVTLQRKFADPQNIFFDTRAKKNNLVLVCENTNSDHDQSEDPFYTFARRYLNKVEYVPFLIQLAEKKILKNTTPTTEQAENILKLSGFILKTAPFAFQLEVQSELMRAWSSLTKNNPEHPAFTRLVDEDAHYLFLMAQAQKCEKVSGPVLKRLLEKKDYKENLEGTTLAAGNDFYNEGLEKSAIYEYRQFVESRTLLKKCNQIPKSILDRYFKFIKAQPYEN